MNKRTIKGPAGKGSILVTDAIRAIEALPVKGHSTTKRKMEIFHQVWPRGKELPLDVPMLAEMLTMKQLTELLCHVAIKQGRRAVVDDDLCEQDGDDGKAPAASHVRTQIIDVATNYVRDIGDMLDDPDVVIRRIVINQPVTELISKIRTSRADRQAAVDDSRGLVGGNVRDW